MTIKKTDFTVKTPAPVVNNKGVSKKEDKKDKSVMTRAKDWFAGQMKDGEENAGGDYGVKIAAAGLTVAGAGTGGYLAQKSVADDTVVMHYDSKEVLMVEANPPDPGKVFTRFDIRILGEYMKGGSGPSLDNEKAMKFMAYLAETRPNEGASTWGQIYDSVQSHSSSPGETYKTLQVIGSVLENESGITPDQAYFEFRALQNRTDNPNGAIDSFVDKFGLKEHDYMDRIIQIVPKHSSPMWQLGRAGAATVGALAGAAVGATIGGVVALIHKVITK
ncbi:MAG: hypothetical protein K8T10_06630 [Candidatus Eremiobacteraeota bacterium]|nr:hypothetical protein [Candidatus Eremiobacteraeota bacterium]